jgi:hypothetical protein
MQTVPEANQKRLHMRSSLRLGGIGWAIYLQGVMYAKEHGFDHRGTVGSFSDSNLKGSSKGRQYERVWIYIPTKVSEDSSFPLKVGDPCLVQLDLERKQVLTNRIGREDAVKLGWRDMY